MYQGYLCLGGQELGNNDRARGYAESAPCPVNWFEDVGDFGGLGDALGDGVYNVANIESAPWFDPSDESTSRFYGVYITSLGEVSSSTRAGSFTEGISDGGVPGATRHAGKSFRVRAWLTAAGEDALETGHSWLDAMLQAQSCGTHAGGSCGATDATFFTAAPPPRGQVPDGAGPGTRPQSDEEYNAVVDPLVRHLHDVICISGPLEIETRRSGNGVHWGRLVEFTLYAGKPWLYGETKNLDRSPTPATVFQDTPFNLVIPPSAELAGSAVIAATNFSLNPSVEVNATGWAHAVEGAVAAGAVTSARVTGELAAAGTSSFRALFTATGASAVAGAVLAQQEVDVSTRPAGSSVSVSMWVASFVVGGNPVRTPIVVEAIWRSGAGGAALRTDVVGTVNVDGGVAAAKSLIPPAGATHVLVRARLPMTSWDAGTIVRLYADALAVTVP